MALGVAIVLDLLVAAQFFFGFLEPSFNPVLLALATTLAGMAAGGFASKLASSLSLSSRVRFGWRLISLHLIGLSLSAGLSLLKNWPFIYNLFGFPIDEAIRLLAYFPLVLGLVILTRAAPVTGRLRLLLDGAISASSVAVLSWYFVVAPVWGQATTSQFMSGWTAAHPIGDIVSTLAAAIFLTTAVCVREWRFSAITLGAGVLLFAIAGNFDALNQLSGNVLLAAPQVVIPFAVLLYALSALSWSRETLTEISGVTFRVHASKLRYFMSLTGPYLVTMSSFGVVAFTELQKSGFISSGVFFLGAALMVLVMLRQVITQMENQGLGTQMLEFNRDLEQIVEVRTAQLQSLYSLSKAVGNSLDVEGVLKNSMDHAMTALNGDALILNLTPFAFSGFSRLTEFVRHQGLEQDLWVMDRMNILDAIWSGATGVVHDSEFRRHMKYAIAPVQCKGKSLGWICILRRDDTFDPTETSLIEGIGAEIGTALENARLYEVARQMADIDTVTGLLNHRATQERFEYMFKAAEDMREPMSLIMVDIDNFRYFNDTYGHLAGDQVLKGVARLLRDVARAHDTPARYGGDEFIIMLPNTGAEDAQKVADNLQALVALEGYPEPGTDRVIPFSLSIGVAAYPANAATRNELIYHANHSMSHQQRTATTGTSPRRAIRKPTSGSGDSFDLLDSMISAVDNKDYYTRAHSEEVTEYAIWIAQELGLSEEAIKTIRFAGLLHDVGKIGIPDEILRKPGHLTDEEYEVMKQHPVVGAMIVSSIPDMSEILPGVKHHHERWDGAGYPDRLAGEAIPLLARILAVPDTFSAMTTDRPYRKGMKWDVAMQKIKEGRGTQFDPTIVDAFFRAIEKREKLAA